MTLTGWFETEYGATMIHYVAPTIEDIARNFCKDFPHDAGETDMEVEDYHGTDRTREFYAACRKVRLEQRST